MKHIRSPWLFFLLVLTIPVAAYAMVTLYSNAYQKLPVLISAEHRVSAFNLQNQSGRQVSSDTWKGQIVIANFFFTHCPSVCPKMMYQLKRVQAYAKVPGLQIASFTVDPGHDTSGRLQEYAAAQQIAGNWNLLTGDKRLLYSLARNAFHVSATDGDGGDNDFIHSDRLVLIDRIGRIRGFYKSTDEREVNDLIRDSEKLAREKVD